MAEAQLTTGRRDYYGGVRYLTILCCAGLAWAQGTQPKAKPDDYETSGAAGSVRIGAEYMVHSFTSDNRTFFASDYLVVEVALFPKRDSELSVENSEFELRVDGKRATIHTAPATEVAQALERRGWQRQRGVEATAGGGNSTVILGGPTGRPPYGQTPNGQTRPVPRAPEPDYRANVPPAEEVRPAEVVAQTALPEGVFRGAVSGYIFFYYKGNAARIRSVDLIYRDAVLKVK